MIADVMAFACLDDEYNPTQFDAQFVRELIGNKNYLVLEPNVPIF